MIRNEIDEAFLALAAFVEAAAEIDGSVADPGKGIAMTVEAAELDMPVELDVIVDDEGNVSIGAVPPLYYVETTVMPVFHQMTLTLEVLRDESHGH